MRLSPEGMAMLIHMDGCRSEAYKNSARLLTIGVGHLLTKDELTSGKIFINGEKVRWRNGLSLIQVDDLLQKDLKRFEDGVSGLVTVDLTQYQFDALIMFAFKIGLHAFAGSTLLDRLNSGHYSVVEYQMSRWRYSGGRVVSGLATRRKKEAKLFDTGVYS